jgi:HAD superfamily hydrolase (TIGR01549 family)
MKSNPSWIKKIKLVAWDLDGTLYQANAQLKQAIDQLKFRTIADKLEVSLKEAKNKFKQVYQELNSNTKTLNHFGINGQQFFIDAWLKLDLEKYIPPNPELAKNLKRLKAETSLKQYILTNSNTQETVLKKLNLIGIDSKVFDQIHTSVEIGYNKPDEEAFQVLWNESGFKKNEIVYVGDRIKTDIRPAKKLGLNAIHISKNKLKVNSFLVWLLDHEL